MDPLSPRDSDLHRPELDPHSRHLTRGVEAVSGLVYGQGTVSNSKDGRQILSNPVSNFNTMRSTCVMLIIWWSNCCCTKHFARRNLVRFMLRLAGKFIAFLQTNNHEKRTPQHSAAPYLVFEDSLVHHSGIVVELHARVASASHGDKFTNFAV